MRRLLKLQSFSICECLSGSGFLSGFLFLFKRGKGDEPKNLVATRFLSFYVELDSQTSRSGYSSRPDTLKEVRSPNSKFKFSFDVCLSITWPMSIWSPAIAFGSLFVFVFYL